jgi:hypothetical protein
LRVTRSRVTLNAFARSFCISQAFRGRCRFRCQSRLIGVHPGPPALNRRAARGLVSPRLARPGLASLRLPPRDPARLPTPHGRESPLVRRHGPLDPRPVRRLRLARTPLERPGPGGRRQERFSSARRRIAARQPIVGPVPLARQVRGPLGLGRQVRGRRGPGPVTPGSRNHGQLDRDGKARTPMKRAGVGAQRRVLLMAALPIAVPLNAALHIAGRGRRRAHRRGPTTSNGDRGGIPRAGRPRPTVRPTVRLAVRPAARPPRHRLALVLEASSVPRTKNARPPGARPLRIRAPDRHARRQPATVRRRPIVAPARTRRAPHTDRDRRSNPALQPAWSGAYAVHQRSTHRYPTT